MMTPKWQTLLHLSAWRGDYFTLEHPGRSLALHLESWQRLLGMEGVYVVEYTTCMFEGSKRRKCQVL